MKFKQCKHFGVCGGCALQDKSYDEQRSLKQSELSSVLAPFWSGEIAVTSSPEIEFYRNKIELGFCHQVLWKDNYDKKAAKDKSIPLEFESAVGFKVKGRFDRAVDIEDCIIYEKYLIPLLTEIRAWAKAEGLDYYDLRKHSGVLRHLLLRQGKNTGESMVVLFASTDVKTDSFVDCVSRVLPDATIYFATNTSMSDTATPDRMTLLKGSGYIHEKVILPKTKSSAYREVLLKLSPGSFFQTNTNASARMYNRVRERVAELRPTTIYDLYGGAGSFSLACADLCEKSVCVESVPQATIDGEANAKLNGVTNVKFFCDKVEDFVQTSKLSKFNSLIIVDPPRAGMHPKAEKAVAESGVKNVLYISCNPKTLAVNLKALTQNYNIKHVEAFDFFPHTNHVETYVELELK
ncbi:23S rRNA (uracil1939-C5)-methyltransferase [Parelusimicrobium proximum]|uniref:23S rRNA (uracil(1939)-C(5))-methyltransferase RlmD n=1 Tax=Parelusimicrobium proximum TaxID=3228953 RepID=UPI003D17280C